MTRCTRDRRGGKVGDTTGVGGRVDGEGEELLATGHWSPAWKTVRNHFKCDTEATFNNCVGNHSQMLGPGRHLKVGNVCDETSSPSLIPVMGTSRTLAGADLPACLRIGAR